MSESDAGMLEAGAGVDAATLALAHAPLPVGEVRAGAPTTASTVLATFGGGANGGVANDGVEVGGVEVGGVEVGVWEMTPGTASDTEADEVFVVLTGRARIEFESPTLAPLEVSPGSVVRLAAGMRTVWTVTETLRKIYVA